MSVKLEIMRNISPSDRWHWAVVMSNGHVWDVSRKSFETVDEVIKDAAIHGVMELKKAEEVDVVPAGQSQPIKTVVANREALRWIVDGDTGLSSKTIWAVMMGVVNESGWYDVPSDGSDFGRCWRLLERIPEWKERLPELVEKFPAWGPIVREWKRLEAAYLYDRRCEDRGKKAPGTCWEIMKELDDEIKECGGWVKQAEGYWTKTTKTEGRKA